MFVGKNSQNDHLTITLNSNYTMNDLITTCLIKDGVWKVKKAHLKNN